MTDRKQVVDFVQTQFPDDFSKYDSLYHDGGIIKYKPNKPFYLEAKDVTFEISRQGKMTYYFVDDEVYPYGQTIRLGARFVLDFVTDKNLRDYLGDVTLGTLRKNTIIGLEPVPFRAVSFVRIPNTNLHVYVYLSDYTYTKPERMLMIDTAYGQLQFRFWFISEPVDGEPKLSLELENVHVS